MSDLLKKYWLKLVNKREYLTLKNKLKREQL